MAEEEDIVAERPPDTLDERLRSYVEAQLDKAREEAEAQAELSQAEFPFLFDWEVVAWGPWQVPFNPADDPGRIIFVGESAYIATAVIFNAAMATNVGGFGADIQLNYHTANTQTMQPAPSLTRSVCLPTSRNQWYYVDVWQFTPQEAACLYEMNVCARICNCNNQTVPNYAAFVRHVYDYDPESLGLVPWTIPPGSPGWQFDRPIRFMVADPETDCCS